MKLTIVCIALSLLYVLPCGAQRRTRPSVSPADSAAAISAFLGGSGGGSGMLYQYYVSEAYGPKQVPLKDTMSMAYTNQGDVRTEMGLFGEKMIVLGRHGLPKYSMSLNTQLKTYTLNVIDSAALRAMTGGYQVTKVGTETVQGYSCVHARLTQTMTHTQVITLDIWTSKDVPGYGRFQSMSGSYVTPGMMVELEQAGCGGFFVKMTMRSKDVAMDMVLETAEKKTFSGDVFAVPAGYKRAR